MGGIFKGIDVYNKTTVDALRGLYFSSKFLIDEMYGNQDISDYVLDRLINLL